MQNTVKVLKFFILPVFLSAQLFIFAQEQSFRDNNHLPKFVFEVSDAYYAWGYNFSGVYIDDQGDIYSYSCDGEDCPKLPGGNITEADLAVKYANKNKKVGHVELDVVYKKYSLVKSLDGSRFTKSQRNHCDDCGIHQYTVYKIKNRVYVPVILYEEGEYSGKDASPEAPEVFQWLAEVTGKRSRGSSPSYLPKIDLQK